MRMLVFLAPFLLSFAQALAATPAPTPDSRAMPSFAGIWVGEEVTSVPHGMADGKTASVTVAVTCIISPDEKQVLWRWRQIFGVEFPSPGRTFQVEAREGRTIKWSSTGEVPELLGHGTPAFKNAEQF